MTAPSDQPSTLVAAEGDTSNEVALGLRLRSVLPHLVDGPPPACDSDPAADAGLTLDLLVASVAAHPTNDRIWLLMTAICAAFPTRNDVDRVRRMLELRDHTGSAIGLLDSCRSIVSDRGEPGATVEILHHGVVVDVDHTAKSDLHTGIQRVSRSLLPLWRAQRDVVPTGWTEAGGALRRLLPTELDRVVGWLSGQRGGRHTDATAEPTTLDPPPRILIPWRSVVVMVEVPAGEVADRLAAIGDYSGNRLVGVAHDAIPVVSADMVPSEDSSKFVRYLTSVKFAARMAGVSAAATAEMNGFVRALATQGLPGPQVVEVALGSPSTAAFSVKRPSGDGDPMVLVVGSHEPRKNHLAILHSAEILWREGLRFSLLFIGGSGWGDEFPRRTAALQLAGRPLQVRRAVPEAELERAYSSAAFTVFPSLHEGFGLPVAESLLHGTPVITSNFGSTAETGGQGGTLLVDPRDHPSLTNAMRILLTDPVVLERLRAEIAARPERTWQDYADELWENLVEPELDELIGGTRNGRQNDR